MSKIYRHNDAEVATEDFDDGAVMINFLTGRYFSLNGAGNRLWAALKSGADEAGLAAVMADMRTLPEAEAGRVLQDVRAFLETLVRERLVAEVVVDALTPPAIAHDSISASRGPYEAPKIDVFDDLEQLIVLDPIHDVNANEGWPVVKDRRSNG